MAFDPIDEELKRAPVIRRRIYDLKREPVIRLRLYDLKTVVTDVACIVIGVVGTFVAIWLMQAS